VTGPPLMRGCCAGGGWVLTPIYDWVLCMDEGVVGELEHLLYKILEGIYYGADTKSDRREYVLMIYGFCKQYIDEKTCKDYASKTISTIFNAHIDGDGDKIYEALTNAVTMFKNIAGDKNASINRDSTNEMRHGDKR